MLSLRKPSESEIISYLIAQKGQPFSYSKVGATKSSAPAGYSVDRHRELLGYGMDTFERAKLAVQRWQMFPVQMTELCWPDKAIEPETIVAVLARAPGFWTLNPCRVVYVIDEVAPCGNDEVFRFGFAYGTLPDHLECGEERFCVEWNSGNDRVHYDLLSFSKPQNLVARVGYPLVRKAQARFRRLSAKAMRTAVQSSEAIMAGHI